MRWIVRTLCFALLLPAAQLWAADPQPAVQAAAQDKAQALSLIHI